MSNDYKIQPMVMSGGSGTRLWPMSRKAKPKQFLPLVSDYTMVQETVRRLSDDGQHYLAPAAICGAGHAEHIQEQLKQIGSDPAAVIIEPAARNTAAVAAVAALWSQKHAPGALVLLSPADQHIVDAAGFRACVEAGVSSALAGEIVTFGVKPNRPHTGYGYIESEKAIAEGVYKIAAFREKPDRKTAEEYIERGGFYWNAGIFLFSPEAMIGELERHAPDILKHARTAFEQAQVSGAEVLLAEEAFKACPSDSVDYAVMEKTQYAAVVAPVDVGWSDIGSWTEINSDTDANNQAQIDCKNTMIKSDGVYVAAIGLEDMVVVATGDAVLIAPRDRAQDVKKVVEELKAKRTDLL